MAESKFPIAAISLVENTFSLCVFTGSEYSLYLSNPGNFRYARIMKIITETSPSLILMPEICEISFEGLNIKWMDPIENCNLKIKGLHSTDTHVIFMLKEHMNHKTFTEMLEGDKIGFLDTFPIKSKDNAYGPAFTKSDLKKLGLICKKESIINEPITKYGKEIMMGWIMNPMSDVDEILEARKVQNDLKIYYPKIIKLLKKCKIKQIEGNINCKRFKETIKAVLMLCRLVSDKIMLKNRQKYIKAYKILRIFKNNAIKDKIDGKLDRLRKNIDKMPEILSRIAKSRSRKYGCPSNIIYFPDIGFILEAEKGRTLPFFSIKGKHYYKTDEMEALDSKFGNIYMNIIERSTFIRSRVESKLKKISFQPFFEFIGLIDAYTSLIGYSYRFQGCFPDYEVNSSTNGEIALENFKGFKQIHFSQKSVVLYENKILREILSSIVLGQIGCKIRCSHAKILVYDKILFKIDQEELPDLTESRFMKEVRAIGEILRKSNDKSLCIIDDIGSYTDTANGIILFSTIIDNLKSKTALVSTQYDYESLKTKVAKASFFGYCKRENAINVIENAFLQENLREDLEGFTEAFVEEVENVKDC